MAVWSRALIVPYAMRLDLKTESGEARNCYEKVKPKLVLTTFASRYATAIHVKC
jgi:hypothetical protein